MIDVGTFSTTYFYADDVQLFYDCPSDDINLGIFQITFDLSAIRRWSNFFLSKTQKNCLPQGADLETLNQIFLNNTAIPSSTSVKSFGFTISVNLKWDTHIGIVYFKVAFALKILRSVTILRFISRRRRVFSLIIPYYLYGTEIYTGCSVSNINNLKIFQYVCSSCLLVHSFKSVTPFVRQLLNTTY